jgi:beta-glucosidase
LSHDGKPGCCAPVAANRRRCPARLHRAATLCRPTPRHLEGHADCASCRHVLALSAGLGTNASISLDGKRLAGTGAFQGGVHGDILQANQDNAVPTTDGLDNVRRAVELTAGPHAIEIKTSPDSSNSPVQVRLNWYTPEQRKADHEAAIAAAKKRQGRGGLCLDAPPAGLRPARRSGQAGRRGRRGQPQHHRRAQHQPARGPALGRQGEGGARNVVAGR